MFLHFAKFRDWIPPIEGICKTMQVWPATLCNQKLHELTCGGMLLLALFEGSRCFVASFHAVPAHGGKPDESTSGQANN